MSNFPLEYNIYKNIVGNYSWTPGAIYIEMLEMFIN